MTMIRAHLAAGLVALAAFLCPSALRADDTIRLKLPASDDATVRPLVADKADLDADTVDVRWGGYRGGYGGYRGGYGGYRGFGGGFYRGGFGGYYGGYRGYGYGYRGFGYAGLGYRGFGYGYYRPRYYGGYGYGYPAYYGGYAYGYPAYYGGYGYPVYSSSYYTYPSYYVSPSYYPCSTVLSVTTLSSTPTVAEPSISSYESTPSYGSTLSTPPAPKPGIIPPMPRADGTYSYDGGPSTPVPMPRGEESMSLPRVPTPVVDHVVSLPVGPKTGKWQYPAYGEQPRRTGK